MKISTNFNEEEISDHLARYFNILQTFNQVMIIQGYYQENDEFLKKVEVFMKQEERLPNDFDVKVSKTISLQSTSEI